MNQQHDITPASDPQSSQQGTSRQSGSRPNLNRPRKKPDSTRIRTRHDDKRKSDTDLEQAFLRIMDKPDPVQLTEVSKLLKEVFTARLNEPESETAELLSLAPKPTGAVPHTASSAKTEPVVPVVNTPAPAVLPKIIPPVAASPAIPAPVIAPAPATPPPVAAAQSPAPVVPEKLSPSAVKPAAPRKPRAIKQETPRDIAGPAPEKTVPAVTIKEHEIPAPVKTPLPAVESPVAVKETIPVTPPAPARESEPVEPPVPEIKTVSKPLRILMVAAELAPYVKSGGLADMVASLSSRLKAMGHDVRVVIPKYSQIDTAKYPVRQCHGPMGVWMGNNTQQWCLVLEGSGDGGVPVYLVEFKDYYERWGIYHAANMDDYRDNPARFGFLCRAALQFCVDTAWAPDIVHAHDWHAAMAPAYVKSWHWNDRIVGPAASVLTIHNISYQGKYPRSFQPYLAIAPGHFTAARFEDGGQINLLKGGLSFSDMVTTVSPTHRNEICTPQGGFGLAPFLGSMGNRLTGILNGVDYESWSPDTDKLIPAQFNAADLSGKRACKRALQEQFGLAADDHIAIIGAVGRFVDQKGFHLIAGIIDEVLRKMHVQFVILGSGKKDLEGFFKTLPARFPGKAGSFIGYSDKLAHLIEAGSDFFLMPSLYEPCGLNQMYSQRYGTLPIVRNTGGLGDTVQNYDQSSGTGTGFTFVDPTPKALYNTLGWVMGTYYDRPQHIDTMRQAAMGRDYSWENSAAQYIEVYHQAIANKKTYDQSFSKK